MRLYIYTCVLFFKKRHMACNIFAKVTVRAVSKNHMSRHEGKKKEREKTRSSEKPHLLHDAMDSAEEKVFSSEIDAVLKEHKKIPRFFFFLFSGNRLHDKRDFSLFFLPSWSDDFYCRAMDTH